MNHLRSPCAIVAGCDLEAYKFELIALLGSL